MDRASLSQALELVERFSARELLPNALKLDQYPPQDFPKEFLNKAEGLGLFSFLVKEEEGGVGGTPEQLSLLLLVLAEKEAGFCALVLSHNLACYFLLDAQREVPKGKLLGFPCYLDPKDLEEVALQSEEVSEGQIKVWGRVRNVVGGAIADAVLVPVKEKEGVRWFYVDVNEPGIKRERVLLSLGLRTASHADLVLEGVELALTQRLGTTGLGRELLSSAYFRFYPAVSAILIGLILGSAKTALSYGLERYQGGEVIANYEQIRFYYARMLAEYYTLKASLERIVEGGSDEELSRLSLRALAGESAVQATMDGVQLLGGYGYMHDYGQEKRMRDSAQAEKLLGSSQGLWLKITERALKDLSQ